MVFGGFLNTRQQARHESGDHIFDQKKRRGLRRGGSRRLAVWRHDQRQQDPWRSKIICYDDGKQWLWINTYDFGEDMILGYPLVN